MTNTEKIIEDATEKFREQLRKNIEKITEYHKYLNLDINKIETIWGDMNSETKKIIEDIVNNVTNALPEKEVICKKKLS